MSKPVGVIVLAAGFSTRFGGSKLLAKLNNGKAVFQQTMDRITEAFPEHLVVTRPQLHAELTTLAPDSTILSFEQAELGMGASLAFAAQHIEHWQGTLVCLGDMPFIQLSTYRKLAEHLSSASIVVPTFHNKPGNPVGFGRQHFSELASLEGDAGGKNILRAHPEAILRLAVDDPGILQDVDTPAELARYQDS